jgi:hypothetical protein
MRDPKPPSPRDIEKYQMPKKVAKPKAKVSSAKKGAAYAMPKAVKYPAVKSSGAMGPKTKKVRTQLVKVYEKPVRMRKTK